MRRTLFALTAAVSLAAPAAAQTDALAAARDAIREAHRAALDAVRTARYQGRNNGPEQTERFSRKVRLPRDGRLSVSNIAGDIVVNTGSGDEVSIEAVKRTRSGASDLANVRIEVDERGGGVDVRTVHVGRNDNVSVDFTITMPAAASVTAHSVSGNVQVNGVRGAVRAETVSGNVTANNTPKVEAAKSVSGSVTLSGISTDGDLSVGSVSGNVTAKSVKVRGLDVSSVSGDLSLTDVTCERLGVKSVSGGVEYTGSIAKGGSYDINVHSGDVRMTLANPSGFVLTASSFSGSVRSELPLTIGGDSDRDTGDRRGRRGMGTHSMRATYGDGSATLNIRTFSGDIVIAKR